MSYAVLRKGFTPGHWKSLKNPDSRCELTLETHPSGRFVRS